MVRLARRLVELVILLSAIVVGSFLLWDALAHLTNLIYFPFDVQTGLIPDYGTPHYELLAGTILSTVFLSFCIGILAFVAWLRIDADSDTPTDE
jgi:hypothetical protein